MILTYKVGIQKVNKTVYFGMLFFVEGGMTFSFLKALSRTKSS